MAFPQRVSGTPSGESPFGDEQLVGIAIGLADRFAVLYEAKPDDPHAHIAGNMLAVSFYGGLSPSDEKHLAAGHDDQVRQFRERFMEIVADELKSVVGSLTRSHVTFFSSVFDPATRTTNMLFVLDLLPDDLEEQRAAIRNWSEQVRRNARELRINHLQTRETHLALREQMQELRLVHTEERRARDREAEGDSEQR